MIATQALHPDFGVEAEGIDATALAADGIASVRVH